MGNKNSGGYTKKVSWNGIDFDSYKSFLKHHGLKSYGSISYVVKYGKQFRGHEIIAK